MITEREYLNALNIVRKYHNQLGHFIELSEQNINKTPIEIWFKTLKTQPSVRLKNVLIDNDQYKNGKPFKYLEDISRKEFRRVRHAGDKTWKEFLELKSK